MELVVEAAKEAGAGFVDLTGGAPELNPDLRWFIEALGAEGIPVQVRTNLTALLEPEAEGLAEFFRDHRVALVASMPCYLEENVRAQRGAGVYDKSIEAIRRLNDLGYGKDPGLVLNLVYNPGGPFLPAPQADLEAAYRKELRERFGVEFTRLLTIANMPIGRFGADLERRGGAEEYMRLLAGSFNPGTVEAVMCRSQVSVGPDGTLYDCDFNLALGLAVDHGAPDHIRDFDLSTLRTRRIVTGEHCFGCTAGRGSSCGGALERA
jgi:radical SAM/Cys-rich protein